METNTELIKNVLDLKYQKKLQEANAVLILATTGIISFIGTFIWKRELFFQGTILAIAILSFCWRTYLYLNRDLARITEEIRRLKTQINEN